jgi:Ca2+/Na+ antiporter
MESCPNIDGNQVKYRRTSGYVSLLFTCVFIYIAFMNNIGMWKVLVFLPAIVMSISLLEASNKTCIVYSSMGIKHMGEKYERERDSEFLQVQKKKSFKIVINGTLIAAIITALVFFLL